MKTRFGTRLPTYLREISGLATRCTRAGVGHNDYGSSATAMKTLAALLSRVSGKVHGVIFDAEIRLRESSQITVEVCSTEPKDTEPELMEAARQGILRGVEHVLSPLSKGASVQVSHLVVNPVDFKPNRLTLHTARELKKLMVGS